MRRKDCDFINWISELADNIPNILVYLVQGYIFLSIYNFIMYKSNGEKIEDSIFGCVITSYVLKITFEFVTQCVNFPNGSAYMIALIIYSAVLSYAIGIIMRSQIFSKVLKTFGIDRTPNKNIWTDIVKDKMWVRVYLKGTNISYFGQYEKGEDFGREPIILLRTYQMLNEQSKPFVDYSKDPKRSVVLNTKDFERIELIDPD